MTENKEKSKNTMKLSQNDLWDLGFVDEEREKFAKRNPICYQDTIDLKIDLENSRSVTDFIRSPSVGETKKITKYELTLIYKKVTNTYNGGQK